jgi:hypothetical protein
MKRLIVLLVFTLALCVTANAALVAHYNFDADMKDSVVGGVGTDGVATGTAALATWANAGQAGAGALMIGNPTGYANYVTMPGFDFTSTDKKNFTVSFWMKANTQVGSYSYMVGQNYYGDYTAFMSTMGSSGKVKSQLNSDTDKSGTSETTADGVANDYKWHMITLTQSGTTGMHTYFDGVEVGDGDNYSKGTYTTTGDIVIGKMIGATALNNGFTGFIDELSFYDNALCDAEIAALVPEPATMALLSLGCVLLRRKNR